MKKQFDIITDIIARNDEGVKLEAAREINDLDLKLDSINRKIRNARNRLAQDLQSVDDMLTCNTYYHNINNTGTSVEIFSDASLISSYLTERNSMIVQMNMVASIVGIEFEAHVHLQEMERVV